MKKRTGNVAGLKDEEGTEGETWLLRCYFNGGVGRKCVSIKLKLILIKKRLNSLFLVTRIDLVV